MLTAMIDYFISFCITDFSLMHFVSPIFLSPPPPACHFRHDIFILRCFDADTRFDAMIADATLYLPLSVFQLSRHLIRFAFTYRLFFAPCASAYAAALIHVARYVI